MKRFAFLSILLGLSLSASAQQPSGTPYPYPGGEAMALRAPERAKWTVTYNPAKSPDGGVAVATEGGQKAPEFSQRVITVKDQSVIFERTLRPKGNGRDKWSCQGVTFSIAPGEKKHSAVETERGLGGDFYSDFSKTDFPGFEWVSRENYVDVRKVMGRDCLMYRRQAPDTVAYVDYRTRLPVVLQKAKELRVYQFDPTSNSSLTLPADAQEFLNARAKLQETAARAAARHGR